LNTNEGVQKRAADLVGAAAEKAGLTIDRIVAEMAQARSRWPRDCNPSSTILMMRVLFYFDIQAKTPLKLGRAIMV